MEATETTAVRLTGADFEKSLIEVHASYKRARIAAFNRYGVQSYHNGTEWIQMQSLPDFEGCVKQQPHGRHVIYDAKVCSQASFSLAYYRKESRKNKSRQLEHMLDRSSFGSTCFFLIHWNERQLKTKSEPAETWIFPVEYNRFWRAFLSGEVKSINRKDCEIHGTRVEWRTPPRGRKPRPDFLNAWGDGRE